MTRKNLKVPEELFLALRDDKDEQQSWPHYLEQRCLHEREQNGDVVNTLATLETKLNQIDKRLERLEEATGR
jgi:hypothetical protein